MQSISRGDGSAVAFDYAASPAPPSSGSHGGHFLLFAPGKKFIAGNDRWPGYPRRSAPALGAESSDKAGAEDGTLLVSLATRTWHVA